MFDRHVAVPREVRDRLGFSTKFETPRDRLEPGDLVFFSALAPSASHGAGVAIGLHQFVHAPSERGVVRVEH